MTLLVSGKTADPYALACVLTQAKGRDYRLAYVRTQSLTVTVFTSV
jgi:hypothetical protein